MIEGIDVSHLQGTIDWPAVKAAGREFAFIKASQGHSFTDPRYHSNVRRAMASGVLVSPYHYFTPTQDATEQARHFLQVAGWIKDMLPPMLDLEAQGDLDPAGYRVSVAAWLKVVEQETGHKAILYTYPDFGTRMLSNAFVGHPLYIASYGHLAPPLLAWKAWTYWQYDEHGRCAGVAGEVDVDRFDGDIAALKATV